MVFQQLALAGKSPTSDASRNESILELISLSTRVAGAICDVPVLNFLKPMVGIAALICDTAKATFRDALLTYLLTRPASLFSAIAKLA
jgi:hypothetical protein